MLKFDASYSEIFTYCEDVKNSAPNDQRRADNEAVDMYLQKHVVPVTDPTEESEGDEDRNKDVKPVGLGRGPLMVDQDDHLLSPLFTYRVNPGGTSPEAQEHATKLEHFLNAVVLRMEETAPEPQWPMGRKDISLIGRGYIIVWPVPAHYSGERFKRGPEEEEEAYRKRYQLELRRKFPIAWRHWSARDTYKRVYGEDEYVLVRYRLQRPGEIIKRFPPDEKKGTGPVRLKEGMDVGYFGYKHEMTVVEYLDAEHYLVIVRETNEVLQRWKHHMGLNPGVEFKGNAVPENPDVKYIGGLYHARHALQAEDEAVSNMLTNLRRDTRATTVVFHSREAEGGLATAKPARLNVRPGGQLDLWFGEEDIKRLGAAQSNNDYNAVIGMLQQSIDDSGLRRVFMGQVKSDTTGSSMRMSGEYAALELADVAQGIRTGGRKIGIRILHAVLALELAVKDIREKTDPDKVYIRYEDKKLNSHEIALMPDDVLNQDDMVQARWELRTPSDERANADMLRLLVEDIPGVGPLLDIHTARERLGQEEPENIDKKVTIQRIRNSPAMLQTLNTLAAEKFRGIVSGDRDEISPEQVMALEQLLGQDPDMLAAILGPEVVEPTPQGGGPSQVPSANTLREGEQVPVRP